MQEKIFYQGDIITMTDQRQAEAVLVRDGRIVTVGSFAAAKNDALGTPEMIALDGAALLPSFIDPHSHITAFANTLALADLSGCVSVDDLVGRMRKFAGGRDRKKDAWIIGFGYDQNLLREGRHPVREELDRVSQSNPVLVTHKSGHMGAVNTRALELLGIEESSSDPQGGLIGRRDGTREPNGYLEETAFLGVSAKVPRPDAEELSELMEQAQQVYLSNGITTIQDGMTNEAEMAMLTAAAERGSLTADVVCYIDVTQSPQLAERYPQYRKRYENRLKIGGFKMFLDGSPQGRTAWMTTPYLGGEEGYCGYPKYSETEAAAYIDEAAQQEMQLLCHCNGDAAAACFLKLYSQRGAAGLRPVMIHAQLVRPDQLPELKALGMIPSFFVAHTYHWGDAHIKNFGMERASQISPARSAAELGLPYTFHQDTPVILPDMLETLWCAVSRVTKSGVLLGAQECVTVAEALRGVTVNGAYQYFEEKQKGTIEAGKLADFVILDRNPLRVTPDEIRNLSVLTTIKEGNVVFQK